MAKDGGTSGKHRRNSHSDEIWVMEFTQESAQEFREKVLAESQENPTKPITVYIDSYGGQVDALAKMIATLDEVPNPIITCCMGKAMSCGAILLSHGDMRYVDKHSRVMVHKVSGGSWGDSEDMANDASEINRLNVYWLGLLADNCGIKGGYKELETKLKSKDGRDRYLDARDSVDFGIADIVGLPRLISATVYEVVDTPEKISNKQRASMREKYKASDKYRRKTNVKSRSKR